MAITILSTFVKNIRPSAYKFRYTICTLVTRHEEYAEMLGSFIEAGFDTDICEYLMINNSEGNTADAYDGINLFLQDAQGEYIIVCHQDILLINKESKQLLDQRIAEMTKLDPKWAVLGNAGAVDRLYKRNVFKIAYPNGKIDIKGDLPQKVCSVDENFIVIKKSANLSLSSDIGGFHFYGLDICMGAEFRGYTCYVIDFLLLHKSLGNVDETFKRSFKVVKNKYTHFLRGRYVNTTIASFYLSGSPIKNAIFNTRLFRRVIKTFEEIKAKLNRAK
ncbi:acyl esterase [Mucilaginibacter rubeus]|uniref:Acyl esterase n=1 Tax=Mucilaginibacter rubeus TaxID=2027860 RepID=A0A5C1I4N0_9SPHI|nr:acyl esterase [Mucilaginibacter rubeus]QEM12816.1 acyl esterase [Mucilaginibacter rubeus]